MKVYLDLRQVFPAKRPPIPRLAKEIGITTDALKHLLKCDALTINRSHLNKVCNYLVREHLVDETDLPGRLFSRSYDRFWPMLSERRHIELLTGFRQGRGDWRESVSAPDSELQFNLLYRLTDDGRYIRSTRRKIARGRVIDAKLIEAWDFAGKNHGRVKAASRRLHQEFLRKRGDRGIVLFGSVKSNPVVDCVSANCFMGAKAFETEDQVEMPGDRSCPFMFLYRREDCQPPSCCGGVRLSQKEPGDKPGIYYQAELGKPWDHVPSNGGCDGALVFYHFNRAQGNRLEMVLGGFSGRATQCLAEYLKTEDAADFWPPSISDGDATDVGVFVVKFTFRASRSGKKIQSADKRYSKVEVIPLAKEVLADRVKATKPKRRKRAVASQKAR